LTAAIVVPIGAPIAAQDPASRVAALGMQKKLATILSVAERPANSRAPARPHRTMLLEPEVNAYFRINGPTFMPEGVGNPSVTIDSGGRVRARALVDLDKALKPKERSWLDPLAWLSGKVEVTAQGTLRAADRKGRLTIEQAALGSVPVPITILQEVISYYTRTPEDPNGFDLNEPFDLPANIWSVETTRGQAVVVQ
jgi:hypothetical protein